MTALPSERQYLRGPWPWSRPRDTADCPRCGRDTCSGCEKPRGVVVQSAADFLAKAQDTPTWLIPDLMPAGGCTMFHGRPRSMKSLAALAMNVDAALGLPVFGHPRMKASRPLRCAYLSEEDSSGLVAARLRWFLAGRAAAPPDTLWLSARKGLNLESASGQADVLDVVNRLGIELLTLDTARAFAASIDKGPSDAAEVIRFLRALLTETPLRSLAIVAHDTKPSRDGKDERARAERASGGALLAAVDCPVNFERLSDREALAVPDRFKVTADPKPFRLTFESASPAGEAFREWLRVEAVETDEQTATQDHLLDAVLDVVTKADCWLSTNAIAERCRPRRRGDVLGALKQLGDAGRIASRTGTRNSTEYRSALNA